MRMRHLVIVILLLSPPCSSAQTPTNIRLGFAECHAAIFVKPEAGLTIRVSAITRDSFGYVDHFIQEIQYPNAKPVVVEGKVDNTTWKGDCSALRYVATINGKKVTSPTREAFLQSDDSVGFLSFLMQTDGTALALVRTWTVVNKFSYENSRRQVARQELGLEGKTYVVAYSEREWDDLDRLVRFKVVFEK